MTKSLFMMLLACAGAAHADICGTGCEPQRWQSGDVLTYTQSSWGGDLGIDAGATLLEASFDAVYGAAGGVVVGSASRFVMVFTDAGEMNSLTPRSKRFTNGFPPGR